MTDIDEPVHIVAYNDRWPELFELEKERIKHALTTQSIAIEHIGSTSVPGLKAKPIIDIMIGINSFPPSESLIRQLCALGYTFKGEAGVPGRLYFTRRGQQSFNLAVVLLNGEHWTTNIKFMNYLRKHPEECQEYEKIKSAAIESGATMLLSYSDFKRDFILSILKKIKSS